MESNSVLHKYAYGRGFYVDTVVRNKKAIEEYIKN
ncbi:transposase [Clostridium baratii]|uniref:Transposase n=1 Tax=Clostridium baratii TaxID=1561 RepID=A0A174S0Z5_9CLOT|nr:transposase [Clostridium baratii]